MCVVLFAENNYCTMFGSCVFYGQCLFHLAIEGFIICCLLMEGQGFATFVDVALYVVWCSVCVVVGGCVCLFVLDFGVDHLVVDFFR